MSMPIPEAALVAAARARAMERLEAEAAAAKYHFGVLLPNEEYSYILDPEGQQLVGHTREALHEKRNTIGEEFWTVNGGVWDAKATIADALNFDDLGMFYLLNGGGKLVGAVTVDQFPWDLSKWTNMLNKLIQWEKKEGVRPGGRQSYQIAKEYRMTFHIQFLCTMNVTTNKRLEVNEALIQGIRTFVENSYVKVVTSTPGALSGRVDHVRDHCFLESEIDDDERWFWQKMLKCDEDHDIPERNKEDGMAYMYRALFIDQCEPHTQRDQPRLSTAPIVTEHGAQIKVRDMSRPIVSMRYPGQSMKTNTSAAEEALHLAVMRMEAVRLAGLRGSEHPAVRLLAAAKDLMADAELSRTEQLSLIYGVPKDATVAKLVVHAHNLLSADEMSASGFKLLRAALTFRHENEWFASDAYQINRVGNTSATAARLQQDVASDLDGPEWARAEARLESEAVAAKYHFGVFLPNTPLSAMIDIDGRQSLGHTRDAVHKKLKDMSEAFSTFNGDKNLARATLHDSLSYDELGMFYLLNGNNDLVGTVTVNNKEFPWDPSEWTNRLNTLLGVMTGDEKELHQYRWARRARLTFSIRFLSTMNVTHFENFELGKALIQGIRTFVEKSYVQVARNIGVPHAQHVDIIRDHCFLEIEMERRNRDEVWFWQKQLKFDEDPLANPATNPLAVDDGIAYMYRPLFSPKGADYMYQSELHSPPNTASIGGYLNPDLENDADKEDDENVEWFEMDEFAFADFLRKVHLDPLQDWWPQDIHAYYAFASEMWEILRVRSVETQIHLLYRIDEYKNAWRLYCHHIEPRLVFPILHAMLQAIPEKDGDFDRKRRLFYEIKEAGNVRL